MVVDDDVVLVFVGREEVDEDVEQEDAVLQLVADGEAKDYSVDEGQGVGRVEASHDDHAINVG